MIKRLIYLLILLAAPSIALAQSGFTTVTATIKDPTGALYTNSQVTASFFDPGTSGKLPLINGSTFQVSYSGYGTDSFGFFSMTVVDNGQVGASSGATNTQWNFSICYVDRQTCFPYKTPINCAANIPTTCTNNTMDLTVPIQAVAALLPKSSSGVGGGLFTFKSVPFNSTISLSGASNTAFNILLTGNVTTNSVNLSGVVPGIIYQVVVCQDGVGGRTFQWPGTFNNPPTVLSTPSSCTSAAFIYNGATWDLFQTTNFQNLPVRLGVTGSNLIVGDFNDPSISGWGAGATITSIIGTDSAFQFTVTAGAGPTINPTIALTYHDGAWSLIRSINPLMIGGTGNYSDLQATSTSTVLTLTYLNLPVTGRTHTFSVVVTGTSNLISSGSTLNPVIQNPTAPQTICCFILNLNSGLNVTGAATFNNGVTGTGNTGTLDLGATALGTSHNWGASQIFPNGSLSLQELVPCANGQQIATIAGVQACSSSSGVNVNGSATSTPLNLGNLPVAQANNLLVTWQYSGGNASAEVPISGNGTQVCSITGSLTNGHIVIIDSNGNCVDGGLEQWTANITSNTCPTGSSTYDTCTYTLTWPSAFSSTAYKAVCTGVTPSNPRAALQGILSRTTTTLTVQVVTEGSVAVSYGGIECHGKL